MNDNYNLEEEEINKVENNKKYKYYEIKVSIKDTHPPVWRRLRIPEGITFHELNAIIQIAFNWNGYHAYSFEIGAALYGEGIFIELPELNNRWSDDETKNSKKEKIDKYFEEYKKMKYTYDFGDDWVHDITVEKIVETDIKLDNPICIKAKMAHLPEDCGGTWGYEDLLEVLSNPDDERYEEMSEWIDEDPVTWCENRTYVDIEEINKKLEDYKEHAKFLLS